jgi:regulator of sigma E protease
MFDPFNIVVILFFLVMLSVLVAAHELGHYLTARQCGMGVEEFAIGMGPKVKTYARKSHVADGVERETEFTIRALPIGGFVKITGMIPEDDGSEVDVAGGFYSKPPLARLWVLFGGPLFSVVAGIAILVPVFMSQGIDRTLNEPVIGGVNRNDPADQAGLKANDRILKIGEVQPATFLELIDVVQKNVGKSLDVTYERDGKQFQTRLTPVQAEVGVWGPSMELPTETKLAGKIGILPKSAKVKVGFGPAFSEAIGTPVLAVKGLVQMFKKPKTIENSVGGPGTMVLATNEAVRGGLVTALWLAGMLSISVGIFNLLPIHPLDGGQMIVAFMELLRGGRRLSMQMQNAFASVGLLFLFTMIIGVLFVDAKRITRFFGDKPAAVSQPAK